MRSLWCLGVLMVASTAGAVPFQYAQQGRVLDSAGAPVNGTVDLRFRLYDSATAGLSVWEELHTGVVVDNGYYAVVLGGVTTLDTAVLDGTSRYLAVKVGTTPEMATRTPVLSVPYAARAGVADVTADLSVFDGVMRACPNGTNQTYNGALGTWNACPTAWNCGSVPTHAGCVTSSAYASCKAIRDDAVFDGSDGLYWVDPDGAGVATPEQVFCLMSEGGGGWTQVFNVDTSDGSYVDYENTAFWTGTAGFGAVGAHYTADYKAGTAFNALVASDVLILAHTEGTQLAWRAWQMSSPMTGHDITNQPSSTTLTTAVLGSATPTNLHAYEGVVRPAGQLQVNRVYGFTTSNDWARFVNAAAPGLAAPNAGDDSCTGIGLVMNVSNGTHGSRWDAGYGWDALSYQKALMGTDERPGDPWPTTNSLSLSYDYAIFVR